MKSYLSLIPISAKVHKRQNRMTILCIVFAVFLVTAVFSMAEMGIRMETTRLAEKHGAQALVALASSPEAQNYFMIAAVLFVLILAAGVLMISGSINSNVAQRTRFFGMMRCIGMSKKQIVRFVRLEALNWCKTAIPIGVAFGIVSTWGLCTVLRFLVGEEFTHIPLFGISLVGIVCGVLIGVVTVLLAASAPARRAAKVSPIAAVSGSAEISETLSHVSNPRFLKIETALGIHHAVEHKKNLLLMTGSFALSIVLFLSCSVFVDFVNCLMPQSSDMPDISISATDSGNSVDSALLGKLANMVGVKQVFARRNLLEVPAGIPNAGNQIDTVDLISYDAFGLDCLAKDKALKKGGNLSAVYGNSDSVLLIADSSTSLTVGDRIQVENETLSIAGVLKYNPFSADGGSDGKITLITSDETFVRLTGITKYSLVLIQTTPDANDEDVEAICLAVGQAGTVQDMRSQRTTNTYIAFVICLYGFLAVIALITMLNIINSISMSVNARIRQYGAMRAVGMEERQIAKMIASEAFTYAISGSGAGCIAGLFASKFLFDALITAHFSYAVWSLPVAQLVVILLFMLIAAFAAILAPIRRIRHISITETINEL